MSAAQEEFNELMRDKEHTTRHPEDQQDETRSFLNLSDDDEDNNRTTSSTVQPDLDGAASHRRSLNNLRNTIPLTRYGANTGPKGVISDAQNFRDSRRIHRNSLRNSSVIANQVLNSLSLRDQQATSEKLPEEVGEQDGDEEEDDDADVDDLDDDFMNKWRQSRLLDLQMGMRDSKIHNSARSRRLYGQLTTVDGDGYLDAVDNSPPDTVVVVYIYDDYSQVSISIEECVRDLASKHQDTRFVKLHFQDAEMEPAGVPALIAYRGGNKFAGLVPLIDEIPEDADVSASTLEAVLKRHQILR